MSDINDIKVTAGPFQSHRDAHWYLIIQYGPVIEHLRMYDPDDAIETLVRLGIDRRKAGRLMKEVK